MFEYFVDTWLIIAFLDRRDQHHRTADRLTSAMDDRTLVTHDGVWTEVLAYFSDEGSKSRRASVQYLRESRGRWTVLQIDRSLFDRAVLLYEERADKQYSLTDCMSMIVMRDRGITHVLTNDHHFRQEGFTVVNE